MLIFYLNYFWN